MPINNLAFGDQVSAWVAKTEKRMEAVMRASVQELVSRCQARIPVDTGFARASIQASLSDMPQVIPGSRGQPGGSYAPTNAVPVVIAQMKLGDTIHIGWTASYVIYLEYGHSQQAPSGFVRVSALEWPQIVSEISQTAEARAGGG